MTETQRAALRYLWFKYGNGGSCHTNANHKFLQWHIEGKHDDAEVFRVRVTDECKKAFDKIMTGDYSELQEHQRKTLETIDKFGVWDGGSPKK